MWVNRTRKKLNSLAGPVVLSYRHWYGVDAVKNSHTSLLPEVSYPVTMQWWVFIVSCLLLQASSGNDLFYPYGRGKGDVSAPINDDGSSPEIPISTLFPFFDHQHDHLIVSTIHVYYISPRYYNLFYVLYKIIKNDTYTIHRHLRI